MFSGFVRALAEYAAPVRHSGITAHDNVALEWIRNRACRIIVGKGYTNVWKRSWTLLSSDFVWVYSALSLNLIVSKVGCHLRSVMFHGRELRNKNKNKKTTTTTTKPKTGTKNLALQRFRTVRYQQSPLLYMLICTMPAFSVYFGLILC